MNDKFIQLIRAEETEELMRDHHCFILLTQIAYRARREEKFDLGIRQSLIGDYRNIGLTRQEYRTSLKKLEKWGFITTKTTNKGTIATLCNDTIYNINAKNTNHQYNQQATNKQPTSNH